MNYLDITNLINNSTHNDQVNMIFTIQENIRNGLGINILDNENYNTWRVGSILEQIDGSIDILWPRGGADYQFVDMGKIHLGEMKACNLATQHNKQLDNIRKKREHAKTTGKVFVEPQDNNSVRHHKTGSFSFHALAILDNKPEEFFVFNAHWNGMPIRLYDIRDPNKVDLINRVLHEEASKWKQEVITGKRSGKFDVISVKEIDIIEVCHGMSVYEHRSEGIVLTERQTIFSDDRITSVYSDSLDTRYVRFNPKQTVFDLV